MDPIILCTWFQMDKHGWFVRDMGRVYDAYTNELYVGGFFAPHEEMRSVNVELWRLSETGQDVVGGTNFDVVADPLLSELVLRPVKLESRLYPAIYDIRHRIFNGLTYETSFETRNRR